MAIHCDPVSKQTNPPASLKTRWIAASLAPLPPRNDNIKIGRLHGLIFYLRLMSWTKKAYCTYLLANRKNGTVYVGVSGNLGVQIHAMPKGHPPSRPYMIPSVEKADDRELTARLHAAFILAIADETDLQ